MLHIGEIYATFVSNSEIEDFVTSWIESSRLERFEHTKSNQLSGGNKRKLSLTISMLGLPALAILDAEYIDAPASFTTKTWMSRSHRIFLINCSALILENNLLNLK